MLSRPAVARHPRGAAALSCAAMAIIFFGLATTHVLYEVYLDCHFYYDMGIYAEAIAKLSLSNPNPYLSARQLTIFSDHFDPILWMAAPFGHLLPPP